jgi:hypothetical protein
LRYLTDSIAGGVQLFVGGLLWWMIGVIIVLTVRHFIRQAKINPAV